MNIERITADRKTYDASIANGLVNLPALVCDLEIDYTCLSLVAPEKNRFRYQLEGFDRDWQDVGNRRQAFYTSLPPRNYRFRVIASNNSGVWNEAGASLGFSIPLRTTRLCGSVCPLWPPSCRCSARSIGCASGRSCGSSTCGWKSA